MSHPEHPLNLSELFADYLRRQVSTHEAGLARPAAEGDVLPYEAGPAQPVEPRVAWDEAVTALKFYPQEGPKAVKTPPEWGLVVAAQEPATALPMCAGNYPQMVRDVHSLLKGDLQAATPTSRPLAADALTAWAEKAAQGDSWPQVLLALGALRLTRQFDRAAALMRSRAATVPAEWKAAWANEEASLDWHQGKRAEAAKTWQTLPECVPVLFNRGLAALFMNQAGEARKWLRQAADKLPETGAWHHLARLYLALAEMR